MTRLLATCAAVSATAVAGFFGTDVESRWYAALDKPSWQPPGAAFGPVWTALYGLTAVATGRALDRLEDPGERRRYAAALGTNLVLNTGWTWLFFRAREPRWAVAEILVLEASTLDLVRRTAKVDAGSAALLVPYAAWVGFAAALNIAIARRN